MSPDLWQLYEQMVRSRLFEEAVSILWEQGLISGEMHLGMGEEAIACGVVCQLEDGDAMALDHRGTPPMLMRGVDPVLLLTEFLGRPDGLCQGKGGHMHLFSPQHLAASSGIVGAAGPTAVGFALASHYLRPGKVAVAFHGEGATNQGMLLESMNLAVAWALPVLFVCKDNHWAITTQSSSVTGGRLVQRALGFGMPAEEVDGSDVQAVWEAARVGIDRGRRGEGPTFLHAHCVHLEGHFLGDLLLRVGRSPLKEMTPMVGPLLRSVTGRKGAPLRERMRGLWDVATRGQALMRDQTGEEKDPVILARTKLSTDPQRLAALEDRVTAEIEQLLGSVLAA